MSPALQSIIKQLITGLSILKANGTKFKLTTHSIVFIDSEYSKAKFKDLYEGDTKAEAIWNELLAVIEEAITLCKNKVESKVGSKVESKVKGKVGSKVESKVKGKVGSKVESKVDSFILNADVIHFRDMLRYRENNPTNEELVQHPVLLTQNENMKFIRKLRDEFRDEKKRYVENPADGPFFDWLDTIERASKTFEQLEIIDKQIGEYPEFIRLAFFIRNCYEHFNDKSDELGYYDCTNVIHDFDELFPGYFAYAFGYNLEHPAVELKK